MSKIFDQAAPVVQEIGEIFDQLEKLDAAGKVREPLGGHRLQQQLDQACGRLRFLASAYTDMERRGGLEGWPAA